MKFENIFKNIVYIVLCILLILKPVLLSAQSNSRGFNYQAIARDKAGLTIVNKDIVIEVSILAGSATGPIVWQEGHEVITNKFGLFNIVIGTGITTGIGSMVNFRDIPWSSGDYYVGIRIDFGNGLVKMGVTKLQAVPYAMVADSVLHPVEYAAGTGITLSSNTFSHALHTGDAIGINSLSVVRLQGRALSANAPKLNDVYKWNGLAWTPSVDDNTIYNAGTGISIAGTTISHLAHSGDATGITTLTITGLQGKAISATPPGTGEILKYNGTAWIPSTDDNTTYTTGTGIILNGTTFSHDAHSGDVTGISSLTVTRIQGRTIDPTMPVSGQVLKWSGTNWSPSVDMVNEYAAGPGLSLNLGTFSTLPHTHTGDVFGQTSLTVQGLQGQPVSANFPNDGEVLKYSISNSQWEPAADNTVNYIAGTGITINSNTIIANNTLSIWNASKLQGFDVSSSGPTANGQVLSWNGTEWAPSSALTSYAAGTGLILSGNTFTADNTSAIWNANQLNGSAISTTGPASNQLLKWNGSEWAPANETAYTAGTGITLSGNTFSAENTSAIWNANQLNGSPISPLIPSNNQLLKWNGLVWTPTDEIAFDAGTGLTLSANTFTANNTAAIWNANQLNGSLISTTAPAGNQLLKWSGSEWTPSNETAYAAGTGIILSGNTFSADNTSAIWNANQLNGSAISTTGPASNQLLKWNGSEWAPTNEIAYAAGTGLAINGNTFINTGDLSSTNELQTLTYFPNINNGQIQISPAGNSITLPQFNRIFAGLVPAPLSLTSTRYLREDGSWQVPYSAGAGITLTGNIFSHTAHTGDANGSTALTVVALQNRPVLSNPPAFNQILKWNGAAWAPAADNNNTYSAGTGLTLNASTFINTGDLSSTNELQNLSYSAASRDLAISSTNTVNLPLFSTVSRVAGLVPGSNNGGATVFLDGTGTWTAPIGTTYDAGTGITLSSNTFSAKNTTALWNANQLQGSSVSTTTPSNNQVLEWNGSEWAPATDDNTLYAAGTGLSLNTGTFSNTGDLSSVNELQNLGFNPTSGLLDISSGTGVTIPLFSTTSTDVGLVAGSNNGGATVFLNGNGAWSAPVGTTYDAGTGITLSSNTFSAQNSTAIWNSNQLQGSSVSTTAPSSVNQVLKWNGTSWAPGTDDNTLYTAGTGLSLNAGTFSNTGDLSSVNELQNINYTPSTGILTISLGIGTTIPMFGLVNRGLVPGSGGGSTNFLRADGSWSAPIGTTYTAGTGLSLNAGTFSNTGDMSSVNELQNLTYATASRDLSISSTNTVNLPLFSTIAGDAGMVPGSATGSPTIFLNGSGAWSAPVGTTYEAGTGITLSSNTFSANNTTAIWNANQLNGSSISTTGPTANQLLKWSGSEWTPSDEIAYAAGTGITLTGNTFAHTDHSGDAIGATTLTVVALQGRSVSTNGPANNDFLGWNGSAWIPMAATSNPYTAGAGITLSGNSFSHTAHTGDATGFSTLTVVALQGRSVLSTAPAANEILKWNGTAWAPATDNNTTYAAGTGITLAGNTFSHPAHTGDATGFSTLTVVALQGRSVSTTAPGSNEFLGWNGSTWIPMAATSNPYAAGTGITLSGISFTHSAHTGDATGITSLTVIAIQGRSIATTAPASNQVLEWNGTDWAPATDDNTLYAAGNGLSLNTGTFTNTGDLSSVNEIQDVTYTAASRLLSISLGIGTTIPFFSTSSAVGGLVPGSTSGNATFFLNGAGAWSAPIGTTYSAGTGITLTSGTSFSHTAHTGDANGSTALTVVAIQGRSISNTIPTAGNYLGWNGATWIPSVPTNTIYSAGTGITLTSGTSFSHTAHTGDANGSTTLTVVAIRGRSLATTIPTAGNYLGWNGATWIPSVPINTTYSAGTGITLTSGTSFSHTAHTGDANGSTTLTVVAIRGRSLATTIPTAGNYLGWNGATWIPSVPINTTYSAGTGITLTSGTSFSHTAHTGDANGSTALTVVAIRGRSISNTIPTAGNYLGWNGATWIPSVPTNTTYSAGTGITLTSGTSFSHTAHTGDANGSTALTVVAIQGRSISNTIPTAGNYLGWNGATWIPTVPTTTTYSAGTGITLTSGTSFSHTAHSGDANGSTALTVVAIRGRSISNTIPTAGNYLGWNGAAWIPSVPTGTTYSAGTGLSLNTGTFSNTGDISSVNEIQDLSYTAASRLLTISLGVGTTIPLFSTSSAAAGLVPGSTTGNATNFLNGAGAWSVPTGTAYAAGTGLSLNTGTFSNTGDLSSVNELQNLSFDATTGDLGITSATGVTIPPFATTSTDVGLVPGSNNGGITAFLNGNGGWTAPVGTTYAAGTGITLAANTFSHTAHTGDANGSTALTVVALHNRSILSTAPAANQILKWNGAAWAPAADNNTTYAAGTGLSLNTGTFSNTGDLSSVNEIQDLSYTAASRLLTISLGVGTTIPLFSTSSATAGLVAGSTTGNATNFLNGAGAWSVPTGTTYAAGTGLSLNTGTFSNTGDLSSVNELQNLSFDATTGALGITSATGVTIPQFATTSTNVGLVPGSNNGGITVFLNGNGGWTAPVGTTYAAGTGITLATNTFSHTAHTGDANGSTALTVVALQNRSVLSTAPAANQVLEWNGAAWAPAIDDNTQYSAGVGITLSGGTVFSHTAHTGDANGSTALTVVALQNRSVLSTAPAANQVLEWNGAAWAPAIDDNTQYSAGVGITLSGGTVFSHTAHTGDANGSTALTVVALQNRSVLSTAPAANQVLEWNGAAWAPAIDDNTLYSAGLGITLSGGTVFSHTAHTGDVTGTTSLTVVKLRGRDIANTIPTTGMVLTWSGSDWGPTNAGAYAAGTGLTLTSSTFSHTAHTGDATGATSLTVVALQGRSLGTTAPTDRNVLTWVNASSKWEPILFTSLADANNDTKITVEANPNEDKIKFNTNGTERMIIDNTGKIGIGTTGSPASTLTVIGSMSHSIIIHNTNPANLTLDDTHYCVIISAATGDVYLPAANTCPGRIYIVKHSAGAVGNIILHTAAVTEYIDGSNSQTIGIYQSMKVISDGNLNWYIIGM